MRLQLQTDMCANVAPDILAGMAEEAPLGRNGMPMDVAKAIENLPRDNADRPLGFARIVKVTYSGPEVSTTEAAEALKNIKKKK